MRRTIIRVFIGVVASCAIGFAVVLLLGGSSARRASASGVGGSISLGDVVGNTVAVNTTAPTDPYSAFNLHLHANPSPGVAISSIVGSNVGSVLSKTGDSSDLSCASATPMATDRVFACENVGGGTAMITAAGLLASFSFNATGNGCIVVNLITVFGDTSSNLNTYTVDSATTSMEANAVSSITADITVGTGTMGDCQSACPEIPPDGEWVGTSESDLNPTVTQIDARLHFASSGELSGTATFTNPSGQISSLVTGHLACDQITLGAVDTAAFAGQLSITSVASITSGTWLGTSGDHGTWQASGPPPLCSNEDNCKAMLAARYSPILHMVGSGAPCTSGSDPYDPESVDELLNQPDVNLMDSASHPPPIVTQGPSAQDLASATPTNFLDLPGDIVNNPCDFEQEYQASHHGAPVTYANVVTDHNDPNYLAVQYWFYYWGDEWENVHESDWEMIQLSFNATSALDALSKDPLVASFSQHTGGETGDWLTKVRKENGTHPDVYVGEGSHANYFEPAYFNWNSGFCDIARKDGRLIMPTPEVVSGAETAWLNFAGTWGPFAIPAFNFLEAPKGPMQHSQWTNPKAWQTSLAKYNPPLPVCVQPIDKTLQVVQGVTTTVTNFAVQVGAAFARFTSQWHGSDAQMTLTGPSGQVISPTTIDPSINHEKGGTYEIYDITAPEAGTWTASLYGADVPPGGEGAAIILSQAPAPGPDSDLDEIIDSVDNCPGTYNPDQTNTDAGNAALNRPGADALGDACDDDVVGDGGGTTLHVYCPIRRADVDGDGVVSILDLSKLAAHFGATDAVPKPAGWVWNPRYSQDADNVISILDLSKMASVFGQHVSACP
jgi:hypothetical protein